MLDIVPIDWYVFFVAGLRPKMFRYVLHLQKLIFIYITIGTGIFLISEFIILCILSDIIQCNFVFVEFVSSKKIILPLQLNCP